MSQPLAATTARPGSMASRRGRASAGRAAILFGRGGREHLQIGHGTSDPVIDREPRTHVQGVEIRQRGPLERQQPQPDTHRRAPRVDSPKLRADVQVDAPPAQRPVGSASGIDELRQFVGEDAELGSRGTDRKPAVRLRVDLGVDAHEHVEAHTCGPRDCRCPGDCRRPGDCPRQGRQPRQRPRLVRRLQAHPQQRFTDDRPRDRPPAAPRDPCRCPPARSRQAPNPARRREIQLARRDRRGTVPGTDDASHEWRQPVCLERVEPQPRIGECRGQACRIGIESGQVIQVAGRAVPVRGADGGCGKVGSHDPGIVRWVDERPVPQPAARPCHCLRPRPARLPGRPVRGVAHQCWLCRIPPSGRSLAGPDGGWTHRAPHDAGPTRHRGGRAR